jgi:membrane dipeptidase
MVTLALLVACGGEQETSSGEDLWSRAGRLAQEVLIVDTHVDVPYRLREEMADISEATEGGDFDYPRAVAGGLNAPFMSIYIPASYQETGGAREVAEELIAMVRGFEAQWPEKFAVATSVADLHAHFDRGVMSLPMGIENGAAIEDDLDNVAYFYDQGIRYVTLTHATNNLICDSSYSTERQWDGLSPFGREVVAEMNRVGIMIDISHVSDDAFYEVLELSEAPVIASHSSCRKYTPGFERNMDDAMIRALADHDGVIQINFGSSFLRQDANRHSYERFAAVATFAKEQGLEPGDHVGIGSDFDGVGDSLPSGLKDVSFYPNLIYELLKRGYSDEDIGKIFGGNLIRVWSEVERLSAASTS